MFFSVITKNTFTDEPYIGCGDTHHVIVDGRHNLETQFQVAWDHFKTHPRLKTYEILGIAAFKHARDTVPNCSLRISDGVRLEYNNWNAFRGVKFY